MICALSITTDIFLTYQIKGLIDCIVNKSSFNSLLHVFYRIIFWGVSYFLISLYQNQKWHYFRYKLINTMRYKMYKSLINKPLTFIQKFTTGDLASRVMNDGSIIAENAGIQILMVILNLFEIIFILSILTYFDFKLSLIVLILIPIYYFSLRKINGSIRNNSKEEREAFGKVQQILIENIKGIKYIKMLNKFKFFSEVFYKALNEEYFSKIKKVINCQILMYALHSLMVLFLPIIILLFGSYLSYKDQISIGTLIAFYTYLGKLLEPLGNLADAYQGSKIALGAADRVHHFIFDDNNIDGNIVFNEPFKEIKININNFSFQNKRIFNNLNLNIYNGDRIFIKGESGKGKTTLLNLIMNFYNVEDGEITINNINIDNIKKSSLYKNILQVPQEPFIFEGTIKENLTLGDNFTDEELKSAIKIACLDDFILEKGWNYKLNEAGINFSGGQRQRLALARVLLRKPKILILDEVTSALDLATEEKLLNNLNDYLNKNKITLISVSHNNKIKELCTREFIL